MFFIRIFLSIIVLFSSALANAVETISIEAKEYNKVDAFIFFHSSLLDLDVQYSKNIITLRSSTNLTFKILTPVSVQKLSKGITNSRNSKTITLKTAENYDSYEVVRGEKLTAIKFYTNKAFEDKKTSTPSTSANPTENPIIKDIPPSEERKLNTIPEKQIAIQQNKEDIDLIFEFDGKDVGAAFFNRGEYFVVAFDRQFNYRFNTSLPINCINVISDEGTVLYFKIPTEWGAALRKVKNNWVLKLKSKNSQVVNNINIDKLADKYGVFLSNPTLTQAINYKDPIIGDLLTIVTSSQPATGIITPKYFADFTVLSTAQGAAISWLSDNKKLTLSKRGLQATTLPNSFFQHIAQEKQQSDLNNLFASHLPFQYLAGDNYHFFSRQLTLRGQLATTVGEDQFKALADMGKFYFVEILYPEAAGAFKLIPNDSEWVKKNPEMLLTKAVILSLLGQAEEAKNLYDFFLKLPLDYTFLAEATVWKNYNNFLLGDKIKPLGLLPYLNSFLTYYPDSVYWKLVFAELDITSRNNDSALCSELFKQTRAISNPEYQKVIRYYKANFYRRTGKIDLAINYFEKVKGQSENDPFNFVRSERDLVDLLLRERKIALAGAIKRLEDLKYLWRGDELEFSILLKTADLYNRNKQYIEALKAYKYITHAFPNNESTLYITHEMAGIFTNYVFNEKGAIQELEDFQVVALFNEFKDLTPIGREGDKVVLQVARRLINLDLLDEAENVLDHQVKYRLQGKDRIITADHLAVIYIMNKKPQLALNILSNTAHDNYNYHEHVNRMRLRAKAYLELAKYEEAINSIEEDESVDARPLKKDIYFKSGRFTDYITITEADILPIISTGSIIGSDNVKDTFRLAICYSMLNKKNDLKTLYNNLNTDNPNLKEAIKFIIASNGQIDIEKLERKFDINQVEDYFKNLVNKIFSLNGNS